MYMQHDAHVHFCRCFISCEHRVVSSLGWDLGYSFFGLWYSVHGAQAILGWCYFWVRQSPSIETDVETCLLCFLFACFGTMKINLWISKWNWHVHKSPTLKCPKPMNVENVQKAHWHVFRRLSSSDAAGLRDGVRSVQSTVGWQWPRDCRDSSGSGFLHGYGYLGTIFS